MIDRLKKPAIVIIMLSMAFLAGYSIYRQRFYRETIAEQEKQITDYAVQIEELQQEIEAAGVQRKTPDGENAEDSGEQKAFRKAYKALKKEIEETQETLDAIRKLCNTKEYIDRTSAALYEGKTENPYIERYFHVEREELRELLSYEAFAAFPWEEGGYGEFLPVGDEVWLRYEDNSLFPTGILIKNPRINISCESMRAGEELWKISYNMPETEKGALASEDGEIDYQYCEDSRYGYYCLKVDDAQPTVLYLTKKLEEGAEKAQEMETPIVPKDRADETYGQEERKEESDGTEFGAEYLADMESYRDSLVEEVDKLRVRYRVLDMLEQKENESAREMCPEMMYEKYLQLRQGEMAEAQGITDVHDLGWSGFLNSHFSGIMFEIGQNCYLQSGNVNYIQEHAVCGNLIVKNPDSNMGYMGARAGMDFEDIQKNAQEAEIQTGFMYTETMAVYYMEFDDGYYHYTYMSDYEDGQDSWIEIRGE